MNTEQELQFLARVGEFAKSATWQQLRAEFADRVRRHISASSILDDPKAGRAGARADELMWVMEFVDMASEREKKVAVAMQEANEEAERVRQQALKEGGIAEAHNEPMPTD